MEQLTDSEMSTRSARVPIRILGPHSRCRSCTPGVTVWRRHSSRLPWRCLNYMTTDYSSVSLTHRLEVSAEGDDLQSLLFHFLDEWLFAFSADDFFFPRIVRIVEFDAANFRIRSVGYGEPFKLGKHPQGTEVKAITYSNMQIYDEPEQHEVFIVV
uniref:Archease domain-containing protein n=1 Tax=Macrostomum lignano TaxID=282301 RepID=A0A1I8JQ34_9PLAT